MHLNISKEFLKGAELALVNELYRVAAANAYYAMFTSFTDAFGLRFWAAQAALRHVGVIREEWSHGGLQQIFGLELIKKRGLVTSRLGTWLNRAYELRCDAHYKEHGVGMKETRRLVQHANEFVVKAEEVTAK